MKLFWKIYFAVVIPSLVIASLYTYVIAAYELADEEEHTMQTNMLASEFITREIEKSYVEFKWPFDSLARLSKRDDFLFWWVVRDDGTIHLANDMSFIGTRAYAYFPQVEQIPDSEKSYLDKKQSRGVFVKSFGKEEWSLWLGFSLKELALIQKKFILLSALLLVSTIGTLGIAVYFTVKYFTKPINDLAKGAERVGGGDLTYRAKIQTKDEVGKLAASFNAMAGKLEESYTRLEEKVQERTAKLEDEIVQRTSAQETSEERIREINCLYGLSKLVERPGIPLGAIFQRTTELIRMAYKYPDFICVRITFNGIKYQTDNYDKSELSQHAQIKVGGEKTGEIEVYYLGEEAESDESPFLTEERDMLDAVAEHLGRIAERRKTGEKLQLFRNLIDQSNDCIFLIEPEWGRFLDANDRTCASLGYTREEMLTMSFKDIEESIRDESAWQQQAEELKLKTDLVIEGRHKRKDATTFYAETSLKYVSQDKEEYIIAVARDITERKKVEEEREKLLEQVESINKELKDFAYIVSHDLKAPLRGIKTLADWMATDYADMLDEEGKERVSLLSGRVVRMHNLIDGVLQYSRVGREKVKRVRVNLNELVLEVIDLIAAPESVEITVENTLPVVECGETRILQVFQNLLGNAVKYMDKPHGRIRIGCVQENGFWKFSVADNGPGIEEAHYERIFQIFQTLMPRDKVESTGVGLSVVKKIVELYGGKIWVESKPGEGSTFFFTLPKQESEVEDDAKLEANIVS